MAFAECLHRQHISFKLRNNNERICACLSKGKETQEEPNMEQKQLGSNYEANVQLMDETLRLNESFDIIGKNIQIGGKRARLYLIDGFAKDTMLEKMLEFLVKLPPEDVTQYKNAHAFSDSLITYVEADTETELAPILRAIFSGTIALLMEPFPEAILIDARTYPARSVGEPEDDRVLRGSHDGFVETLVFNTALIRRRIRDTNLTMEFVSIGEKSKTDVVICFMKNSVDQKLLETIRQKLQAIDINALSMGQESLAECLLKPQWYNPFPRIRYTERPDTASASVLEGNILIITDNSPSVMILPTNFLQFVQDANDYYFPPLVGTYLRFVRMLVFLLTLLLTPVWYLLIRNPDWIPGWLSFIVLQEQGSLPVIVQLLLIELVIDGLKLASLNTPGALSNSFSVVGALILGDFAVGAGWFVPEVVLYMAFVAIATFAQPSFELGYAFKLWRVVLLILTTFFNLWGFLIGCAAFLLVLFTTKTIDGRCYLYPLIPFNATALSRLLWRRRIHKHNN